MGGAALMDMGLEVCQNSLSCYLPFKSEPSNITAIFTAWGLVKDTIAMASPESAWSGTLHYETFKKVQDIHSESGDITTVAKEVNHIFSQPWPTRYVFYNGNRRVFGVHLFLVQCCSRVAKPERLTGKPHKASQASTIQKCKE